jgi:hypothetical protein
MRMLIAGLLLTITVVAARPEQAHAGAGVTIWPSEFSYGTPSGTVTWNTTALGLRFSSPVGPFLGIGADVYYGTPTNLRFNGSPLSGYSGQAVGGELALRFGTGLGPVGATAFAGYGVLSLNASGPTAPERIVLYSTGFRLGAEARVTIRDGLALKGRFTGVTGLNSSGNLSLTSPPLAVQDSGTGSGSEYEVSLSYSPVGLVSVSVGYRAGNHTTNWSSGGSTTTRFSGFFVGAQTGF